MSTAAERHDPAGVRAALRNRPLRHANELVIKAGLAGCAFVSLATTALIIFVLLQETVSFFQEVSFSQFFLDTEWQPLFKPTSFGIWELVAGAAALVLL